MIKVDATRRDEVCISALIEWPTLRDLLLEAVIAKLPTEGPDFKLLYDSIASTAKREGLKIEIKQDTEGSSEYSVPDKWWARVSLVFTVPTSQG